MKKYIIGLIIFGLTTQLFAQIIELPEVVITAVNYKYLNAVDTDNSAIDVKMLREQVAFYDLKNSDLYGDEYDMYTISFYIPDGKILAAYNKNGKIIRTIEKFNNVKLPNTVRDAVIKRFPNWTIIDEVYRVNYHNKKGVTKKQYKIKLENGEETLKIKMNEDGDFL